MTTTDKFSRQSPLSRRAFTLGSAIALANSVTMPSWTENLIGIVVTVRGAVNRKRQAKLQPLIVGSDINDGDIVATSRHSYAELKLTDGTRILLGSETEFVIDRFAALQGGTLELVTGKMVFDRPEKMPKIDVSVRTIFGMLGVRGTKFFCGPNRGVHAIFVEHGLVTVEAGGMLQPVGTGEGLEITRLGAPPSNCSMWDEKRIAEAYAGITLASS
ncbi:MULTISPECIES: FecR domain-containing protein [unclassified Mesorhizobium]|uniref:FecR family protein n=1 Tax=unclassified Mesorhizobium TaxID=325217 RepID=UPI000FE3437D|nr:FecR domain-containing protein [Mesorhizobium sp.]RWN48807.1 MAG: iron dicitrate transport regulator FecR [Mesorhizobium sp.]RWN59671.1 MAG: iron dicitrate transport regulator FecR [Mesorhizobium sp.]RWN68551.1 MAG: iron dicitrate transport regulator FecR [Mesorhizobium sp.]RWN70762.1 MAG: iron dicitrate transport regulator FecR [Mesorhizobium sp.]RWN80004.1 MAG: iron dicitrate transport regulator FecR [Mesorhizobium sp.]